MRVELRHAGVRHDVGVHDVLVLHQRPGSRAMVAARSDDFFLSDDGLSDYVDERACPVERRDVQEFLFSDAERGRDEFSLAERRS